MSTKVAVVSGSNKGIGFAIVRGLCKQFNGHVYLTSRNEENGRQAVKELEKEGLHPQFHQLDVTDSKSIETLKLFLLKNYGGLDILVNNAGIAYKEASTAPFAEQAEVTIKTNFTSTLNMCKEMFPILRSGARVVNISSYGALLALPKCSPELQQRLKSLQTLEEVEQVAAEFVMAAKEGRHEANGWPNSGYRVSKLGVSVATPILQKQLDSDRTKSDRIVNDCNPGYVNTEMTSHKGTQTVDEGADTPLYAALLPPGTITPKGMYISERKAKLWKD